jgi:hypothetical protein
MTIQKPKHDPRKKGKQHGGDTWTTGAGGWRMTIL